MELTKNIFFNTDKLVENTTVKLSYTGDLYDDEYNGKVFIHYGYGQNWDNLNEIEMVKTELGYQTEVTLNDSDTFNFCFKNSENIWDNNNGENYVFPIEKINTDLVVVDNNEFSLSKPRRLRKSYIWSKKIRLAVYKLFKYFPKIISGNYKRKVLTQTASVGTVETAETIGNSDTTTNTNK